MGIPGLWKELEPARKTRALTHLAVADGFERNKHLRGYRVGIDASLWFFHAQMQKIREGENPELRMFFFRCCKLLMAPFLPLFVFDGPHRPKWKRGKRVGDKEDWMTEGAKNIIEAFGFEWMRAPGEAEAQLAFLNRSGYIDAVITDDVDAFLFGATVIIRNPSLSLSGNLSNQEDLKNAAGRHDDNHAFTYTSEDISAHESIKLTTGGMILMGLLSGGDYHEAGLYKCGLKISHGLAKAGLGDSLFNAALSLSRELLNEFLVGWREQLIHELRTDQSKYIGRRQVKLAQSVPDSFPDVNVLLSYVRPVTSETHGTPISSFKWDREPDLSRMAGICELYFEWGVKDIIVQRFRKNVFAGIAYRALRRAVMDVDTKERQTENPSTPQKSKQKKHVPGTPSSVVAKYFTALAIGSPSKRSTPAVEDEDDPPIISRIHSQREHVTTDMTPEYRVEIDPRAMVLATEAGVRGTRPPLKTGFFAPSDEMDDGIADDDDDDDGSGTTRKMKYVDKDATFRTWLPVCMMEIGEVDVVNEYLERKANKGKKKAGTKKKAKQTADDPENQGSTSDKPRARARSATGRKPKAPKGKGGAEDRAKVAVELSVEEPETPTKAKGVRAKKHGSPVTAQSKSSHNADNSDGIALKRLVPRSPLLDMLDETFAPTIDVPYSKVSTRRGESSGNLKKADPLVQYKGLTSVFGSGRLGETEGRSKPPTIVSTAPSRRRRNLVPTTVVEVESNSEDEATFFLSGSKPSSQVLGKEASAELDDKRKQAPLNVLSQPTDRDCRPERPARRSRTVRLSRSFSDEDLSSLLRKSPRKSAGQRNPRRQTHDSLEKKDVSDSDGSFYQPLPISPELADASRMLFMNKLGRAGSHTKIGTTVIDISSDDEPPVAPINRRTGSHSKDVIDLT